MTTEEYLDLAWDSCEAGMGSQMYQPDAVFAFKERFRLRLEILLLRDEESIIAENYGAGMAAARSVGERAASYGVVITWREILLAANTVGIEQAWANADPAISQRKPKPTIFC